MIQVTRTAKPAILVANETRWLAEYQTALQTLQQDPKNAIKKAAKTTAEKKYAHKDIKSALEAMFSGKCAYCESQVLHIDFGDIEHFRPKSNYPNECFNWDNLLLGCGKCNGASQKGEHFPDHTQGGPLVNPVEENPDDFFEFEFDPATGTANVIHKNQRGETTKTLLGLNRTELVEHRSKVVRKMVFVAIIASQGDMEARRLLHDSCQKENEYSAFAKALAVKFNL